MEIPVRPTSHQIPTPLGEIFCGDAAFRSRQGPKSAYPYAMVKIIPLRSRPRHDNQLDLFSPTFYDIAFRDQQDLMERPFYSLSKKPRKKPIRYQSGQAWVEVTANAQYGMATIYDHDIMIWAASQIREAADRNLETGRRILFHPHQVLTAIKRETGGDHYERLKKALNRLTGTMVRTNIRTGDTTTPRKRRGKREVTFHLLESWGFMEEEDPSDDRWFLEVPTWFYKGVLNHQLVLTIHPDYFLLESGLDRFLFRCARKHTGRRERGWPFTMRQLYEKSGTTQRFSDFARDIRKAIARQDTYKHIPEYLFSIEKNGDDDEVIYPICRYKLEATDPHFLFQPHPRRRVGGGFTTNKYRADPLRKPTK